jgi:hypothetical protein
VPTNQPGNERIPRQITARRINSRHRIHAQRDAVPLFSRPPFFCSIPRAFFPGFQSSPRHGVFFLLHAGKIAFLGLPVKG